MTSDLSFLLDLAIQHHRIRYAGDSSQLAPMVFLCRSNAFNFDGDGQERWAKALERFLKFPRLVVQ